MPIPPRTNARDPHPPTPIRPARSTDYDIICTLIAELDRHHRESRPDIFREPIGPTRDRTSIDQLIAGPNSTILVADHPDHGIIGLIILIAKSIPATIVSDARRIVELDQLIVATAHRRQAIAQALIHAATAWAAQHAIDNIEVTAWSFNRGAIALYRKLGFQPKIERFALSLPADPSPS
ncbi:GNAT family N-acetyltransferase [Acidiphilium sp. MT5]